MGLFLPSHPFFLACSGFPRSRVSSTRPLAHLPLPLSLSMSIKLGGTFLGTNLFLFIFLFSLTTLEEKPVCHIYQSSVCNHCERMLDGHTLDDLIYGSGECLLTEDEVVAYVRRADPKYQGWDDWPLRMTYRINSFLRANGSNPELTCDQAFFFFPRADEARLFNMAPATP